MNIFINFLNNKVQAADNLKCDTALSDSYKNATEDLLRLQTSKKKSAVQHSLYMLHL